MQEHQLVEYPTEAERKLPHNLKAGGENGGTKNETLLQIQRPADGPHRRGHRSHVHHYPVRGLAHRVHSVRGGGIMQFIANYDVKTMSRQALKKMVLFKISQEFTEPAEQSA